MHQPLWPACCSGGLFPGLAPLPCVTRPSWPRLCLAPQQIIQSSLVPCVWDMSHHAPPPCPVLVTLGSAPGRGVSGKGGENEAAACDQNSLSPCSNFVHFSPPRSLFIYELLSWRLAGNPGVAPFSGQLRSHLPAAPSASPGPPAYGDAPFPFSLGTCCG